VPALLTPDPLHRPSLAALLIALLHAATAWVIVGGLHAPGSWGLVGLATLVLLEAALLVWVLTTVISRGGRQEAQARLLNEALADANSSLASEVQARERAAISLRMLLDAMHEGIVVVDAGGQIVEVNDALERMLGYTRGQLIARPGDMLVAEHDRETVRAYQARYAAAPADLLSARPGRDLTARRADGTTFAAQVGLSPYHVGDQLRIIATVRDVTAQRAVERRMATSLREKEVLLREVHHRVKNNMAVMSSLFYLQARHANDPETVRVFRESESRVHSMAMVHEVLYRSDDLSSVDFGSYLDALLSHLMNVYRGTVPGLRLERDIAALHLSLDQAVPCGLLLNELLTNAFKHAFVDAQVPVLRVRAAADGGHVRIDVMDNGVGMPADVPASRPATLGLRLMRALVEQLDGTIETSSSAAGTRTRLVFPVTASTDADTTDAGPIAIGVPA